MMKSRHQPIRDLLLASNDGMTVNEIAEHFACGPNPLYTTMPTVFGVYIDRWIGPSRGQYTAVYMCIKAPEDAPHP